MSQPEPSSCHTKVVHTKQVKKAPGSGCCWRAPELRLLHVVVGQAGRRCLHTSSHCSPPSHWAHCPFIAPSCKQQATLASLLLLASCSPRPRAEATADGSFIVICLHNYCCSYWYFPATYVKSRDYPNSQHWWLSKCIAICNCYHSCPRASPKSSTTTANIDTR